MTYGREDSIRALALKSHLVVFMHVLFIGGIVLAGCNNTLPIDSQVKVSGGQVYRLTVYMEIGQTIKGSWKSDNPLYVWWTNPAGAAFYPLNIRENETLIRSVVEPGSDQRLGLSPGFFINDGSNISKVEPYDLGAYGGTINIESVKPYAGSGYYTLCFLPFPFDTPKSAIINIHYWIK